MPYTVRKNWLASLDLIKTHPIALLPFLIIAFFEALALELIYFFPRKPIVIIVAPIVRKFFGEAFLHYPANLILLPRLFYYAQIVIYIFISVFLTAICVNIVKNIKMHLPIKARAIIRNIIARYVSLVIFGIILIVLLILAKRVDMWIFLKLTRVVPKSLLPIIRKLTPFSLTLSLFFSNIILQAFLILTIPVMIIKKQSLLKALLNSIYLGLRNFFKILGLIFLPFLLYLPLTVLKNFNVELIDKTFPEISLIINGVGIILAALIDCFIIVCVSQWFLDREKAVSI